MSSRLAPLLLAVWCASCGSDPIEPPPNPVPVIVTLEPDVARVGSAAITLSVRGHDFLASTVVRWNGAERLTTHLDSTQLRAAISASDLVNVTTVAVTAFTPGPGGGSSAPLLFTIRAPVSVVDTIPGDPTLDGWADGLTYGVYGFPVRTGDYDNGRGGVEEPPFRQFFGFQLPTRRQDLEFEAATLVLDQCVALGDPFVEGPVVVDHLDYGSMIALAAYDQPALATEIAILSTDPTAGYRTISVTESVMADWLASRVRTEFRVRFAGTHVGNGTQDFVVFRDAHDQACPAYPGIGGAPASDRTPRLLLAYSY